MRYYILFYEVVPDYLARRVEYRDDHLRRVREAHGRGELVMAGALSEPADGAVLVFRVSDAAVVENFARDDPYVTNGLVTRWEVRAWTVVVGG
jgi:uncharacterized protein YciI